VADRPSRPAARSAGPAYWWVLSPLAPDLPGVVRSRVSPELAAIEVYMGSRVVLGTEADACRAQADLYAERERGAVA
jgi:hypothetical protein